MSARYFRSSDLQFKDDVEGARYWSVALDRAMLTYFEVAPKSRFERHAHESEQITLVLDGVLYFELDDGLVAVGAGEAIAVPSNVPHAVFTGTEAARAVDAWSPIPITYRADACRSR